EDVERDLGDERVRRQDRADHVAEAVEVEEAVEEEEVPDRRQLLGDVQKEDGDRRGDPVGGEDAQAAPPEVGDGARAAGAREPGRNERPVQQESRDHEEDRDAHVHPRREGAESRSAVEAAEERHVRDEHHARGQGAEPVEAGKRDPLRTLGLGCALEAAHGGVSHGGRCYLRAAWLPVPVNCCAGHSQPAEAGRHARTASSSCCAAQPAVCGVKWRPSRGRGSMPSTVRGHVAPPGHTAPAKSTTETVSGCSRAYCLYKSLTRTYRDVSAESDGPTRSFGARGAMVAITRCAPPAVSLRAAWLILSSSIASHPAPPNLMRSPPTI